MIFYSDGIFPLWGLIIVFIVLYYLNKENKENKISQKKIDESRAKIDELQMNMDDFNRAKDAIDDGAQILKLDDYKYLTQRDIKFYNNTFGVKFI